MHGLFASQVLYVFANKGRNTNFDQVNNETGVKGYTTSRAILEKNRHVRSDRRSASQGLVLSIASL